VTATSAGQGTGANLSFACRNASLISLGDRSTLLLLSVKSIRTLRVYWPTDPAPIC